LSVISGIWVGQQLLQFIFVLSGNSAVVSGMEVWAATFFLIYFLCIGLYAWGTWHMSDVAKISIKKMLEGDLKRITYVGAGVLAILLPLIFTLIMWGGSTNGFLIFLRLASVLAGDLAIRYLIMKTAVYNPLL